MKKDRSTLNALKKENKKLKKELSLVKRQLRTLSRNGDAGEFSSYVSGKAANYSSSSHYVGFLIRSLKTSSIYARFRTLFRLFSRFRIISYAVKLVAWAVMLLETGAHFIIFSTLAIITLPISTVLGIITFLVAYLGSNKANKRLLGTPDGKNVYIFFPQKLSQLRRESFLSGWINELSDESRNLIVIVSPAFWKRTGFHGGRYYLHYRFEKENVILLRKYYFFSFKKNVLQKSDLKSICMIH